MYPISEQDAEILIELIKERRDLNRRLSGLTDFAIAQKLDISIDHVKAMAKEYTPKKRWGLGQ